MIEVLRAGLQCTVQDLGRDGLSHWGIAPSGAADSLLLRAGNLLVGNPEGAAAVEITGWGGEYRFLAAAVVSVIGDFPVTADGVVQPPWEALALPAGTRLRVGNARSGFRGYLCVAGGIAVPVLWGSRSTYLPGRLGGWRGRALRRGDRLPVGEAPALPGRAPQGAAWLAELLSPGEVVLRVTPGPHAGKFPNDALEVLCLSTWRVLPASSRMGLRLQQEDGANEALWRVPAGLLSEGVPAGAVQVTPSGEPIVLGVDSQTTGGYPVLASVIAVDRRLIGQLAPGATLRFECVSLDLARELLMEQESRFYHWKEGL
jgi:antagonist of KipI